MAEASPRDPNETTRHSDDPDYKLLWSMSFRELAEIENDPDNPLHEKAKVVGREISAPIRSAIWSARSSMLRSWSKDAVGVAFKGLPNAVSSLTFPPLPRDSKRDDEEPSDLDPEDLGIELDVSPDTTATEAQDAMQAAANGFLEQLVGLQAKQLANQETEAKKGEKREKMNRFILWGTLGAAVLTLIATVVLGMPGFLANVTP